MLANAVAHIHVLLDVWVEVEGLLDVRTVVLKIVFVVTTVDTLSVEL